MITLTFSTGRQFVLNSNVSVDPITGEIATIEVLSDSFVHLNTAGDMPAVIGINLEDVYVNGSLLESDGEETPAENRQTASEKLIAIFEAINATE